MGEVRRAETLPARRMRPRRVPAIRGVGALALRPRSVRVGKTFFACALAKRLVDMGVSVRFENSRHLMTEIQGIFGGRSTDALDRAHNCRVLVLDDLGKEQATEFAISMLYELVDGRYMQGKPTVVTSNFSRGELMTRLCERDAATAESIVSRLCENADTLLMDGEDRRLA